MCLIAVQFKKGIKMKTRLIAISLAATLSLAALPAHADITGGGVVGAITGGLLGSQVGQGNGRIAASALGAVLGFNAGQTLSQQSYSPPPRTYYVPSQRVYYDQPRVVYYGPPVRWRDDNGYYRRGEGERRYYRRWGDDD